LSHDEFTYVHTSYIYLRQAPLLLTGVSLSCLPQCDGRDRTAPRHLGRLSKDEANDAGVATGNNCDWKQETDDDQDDVVSDVGRRSGQVVERTAHLD